MSNRLHGHILPDRIATRENDMRCKGILAILVLALFPSPIQASPSVSWVESWGTALPLQPPPPSPFGNARPPAPPPPQDPAVKQDRPAAPNPRLPYPAAFEDQTVRMIVRPTIGAKQFRLEFANRNGAQAVQTGAIHAALANADGSIIAGTDRAVTFSGRPELTLLPGSRVVSDPVELPVGALAHVAVSIYLPDATPTDTVDDIGLMPAFIAPGNQVAHQVLAEPLVTGSYFWLRGLSVPASDGDGGAIVTLGDSITEGYATTFGTHRSWPDLLAERLQAAPGLQNWAVINTGISGNRILRAGAGDAAIARFTEDVLSRPGVRWVVVLESINDINMSIMPGMPPGQIASAEEIIVALDQLIERAHLHRIEDRWWNSIANKRSAFLQRRGGRHAAADQSLDPHKWTLRCGDRFRCCHS